MRTYTFLISIVTHVLAVCAIVIATVTATDTLPDVRRAVDFIVITAPEIQPPPPPIHRRPAATVPVTASIPLTAPEGFHPEPVMEPAPADLSMEGIIVHDVGGLPPPAIEPPPPAPAVRPIRPGGQIQPPQRISSVPPVYPPLAKAAQVQGTVILEATIADDGRVTDVRVLRSIQLLDAAAIEAVRQWRFTPTLLNGTPVPVVMTVTVTFNLR